METEDQKKDRERLENYIRREQLVSIMNNTKWAELRELMLSLDKKPRYRVQCSNADSIHSEAWDRDWYYHLPPYKAIEWLGIDPIITERRGHLLPDKLTNQLDAIVGKLSNKSIPYSMDNSRIRVWGYKRPGRTIDFA